MRYKRYRGFTLIEILIVISIIAMLAGVVLQSVRSAQKKAYSARSTQEFKSMALALELYQGDNNGNYPSDASRSLPPGLEQYLAGGAWPTAPWPNSVYDWDNWDDPDFPGEKIYQISVRFCPSGGPLSACTFPNEPWATNFDIDSAAYYCISGNCRSHASQPKTYPGYCVNC
jgi:prepilin-type N-terminal cleavage/methylation domain-containing protein